jgi:NAD+ diphosphatase
MSPTPLTVYLPFNRERLGHTFVPAKGGSAPAVVEGQWLIVQDQGLLVVSEGGELGLPRGGPPFGLDAALGQPFWLGTWQGTPCWVAALDRAAPLPAGLHRETLIPMRGPRLPDELLSLGGMAMQALHWESTSGHCPRCGAPTERMPGEWGKRCPACRYEHYPHLHPAVIVLVRDGDRCLLARKREWAPNRYALVAGFVDNGESLEGAVRREVKEEVGVDVTDVEYVGSQNWPFPSQLMVGFVAAYAGGSVVIDADELEDARWFSRAELPPGPSRHSIAGFILEHYARRATPGPKGA